MAVLIDSSVFIGMERRGLQPDELVALVPDEPVALASVSVSVSELLFGVERANTPERRARRERFVEAILSISDAHSAASPASVPVVRIALFMPPPLMPRRWPPASHPTVSRHTRIPLCRYVLCHLDVAQIDVYPEP